MMKFLDRMIPLKALDDTQFMSEVAKLKRFYKSGKVENQTLLEDRKDAVAIWNKGIKPHVDKRYMCLTCGSTDGKEHPDTGFCFHCDTDNWENIEEGKE